MLKLTSNIQKAQKSSNLGVSTILYRNIMEFGSKIKDNKKGNNIDLKKQNNRLKSIISNDEKDKQQPAYSKNSIDSNPSIKRNNNNNSNNNTASTNFTDNQSSQIKDTNESKGNIKLVYSKIPQKGKQITDEQIEHSKNIFNSIDKKSNNDYKFRKNDIILKNTNKVKDIEKPLYSQPSQTPGTEGKWKIFLYKHTKFMEINIALINNVTEFYNNFIDDHFKSLNINNKIFVIKNIALHSNNIFNRNYNLFFELDKNLTVEAFSSKYSLYSFIETMYLFNIQRENFKNVYFINKNIARQIHNMRIFSDHSSLNELGFMLSVLYRKDFFDYYLFLDFIEKLEKSLLLEENEIISNEYIKNQYMDKKDIYHDEELNVDDDINNDKEEFADENYNEEIDMDNNNADNKAKNNFEKLNAQEIMQKLSMLNRENTSIELQNDSTLKDNNDKDNKDISNENPFSKLNKTKNEPEKEEKDNNNIANEINIESLFMYKILYFNYTVDTLPDIVSMLIDYPKSEEILAMNEKEINESDNNKEKIQNVLSSSKLQSRIYKIKLSLINLLVTSIENKIIQFNDMKTKDYKKSDIIDTFNYFTKAGTSLCKLVDDLINLKEYEDKTDGYIEKQSTTIIVKILESINFVISDSFSSQTEVNMNSTYFNANQFMTYLANNQEMVMNSSTKFRELFMITYTNYLQYIKKQLNDKRHNCHISTFFLFDNLLDLHSKLKKTNNTSANTTTDSSKTSSIANYSDLYTTFSNQFLSTLDLYIQTNLTTLNNKMNSKTYNPNYTKSIRKEIDTKSSLEIEKLMITSNDNNLCQNNFLGFIIKALLENTKVCYLSAASYQKISNINKMYAINKNKNNKLDLLLKDIISNYSNDEAFLFDSKIQECLENFYHSAEIEKEEEPNFSNFYSKNIILEDTIYESISKMISNYSNMFGLLYFNKNNFNLCSISESFVDDLNDQINEFNRININGDKDIFSDSVFKYHTKNKTSNPKNENKNEIEDVKGVIEEDKTTTITKHNGIEESNDKTIIRIKNFFNPSIFDILAFMNKEKKITGNNLNNLSIITFNNEVTTFIYSSIIDCLLDKNNKTDTDNTLKKRIIDIEHNYLYNEYVFPNKQMISFIVKCKMIDFKELHKMNKSYDTKNKAVIKESNREADVNDLIYHDLYDRMSEVSEFMDSNSPKSKSPNIKYDGYNQMNEFTIELQKQINYISKINNDTRFILKEGEKIKLEEKVKEESTKIESNVDTKKDKTTEKDDVKYFNDISQIIKDSIYH